MNNLLKLQYRLIYAYAFLISFEHILEFLYQVETVLKPYRIIGLFIIINGLVLSRYLRRKLDIADYLFLGLYAYNFLFTILLVMLGEPINQAGFWSDMQQIALNALVFVFMRSLLYTEGLFIKILKFYILGVLINALVMVFSYYTASNFYGREAGFGDSSNMTGFGILLALAILFSFRIYPGKSKKLVFTRSLLYLVPLTFLFVGALLATGSRGGLIMLAVLVVLIVFLAGAKRLISIKNILIFIVVLFIGNNYVDRIAFDEFSEQNAALRRISSTDDDVRWALWKSGIDVFEDSNYLGIGMAQFRSNWKVFSFYTSKHSKAVVEHRRKAKKGLSLHNLYIETLTSTGIVGITLLLLFFAHKFRKLYFTPPSIYRGLALVALILFAVNSMSSRGVLHGYTWFALLIIAEGNYLGTRRKPLKNTDVQVLSIEKYDKRQIETA